MDALFVVALIAGAASVLALGLLGVLRDLYVRVDDMRWDSPDDSASQENNGEKDRACRETGVGRA